MFKEQKSEESVSNTGNVTGVNVGLAVSLIPSFPLIACLVFLLPHECLNSLVDSSLL